MFKILDMWKWLFDFRFFADEETGGSTATAEEEETPAEEETTEEETTEEAEPDSEEEKINKIVQNRLARQKRTLSQEFENTLAVKNAELAALKGTQKVPDELVKPTRPNPDDFEDDTAAYDRAMEKHHDEMDNYREKKFDQKLDKKLTQGQAVASQRERQQRVTANYAKEETKISAKIEDYDEVVGDVASDLKALGEKGAAIMSIIQETGNPHIIYELKDPDKLEKVMTASTPMLVMRELTKIEAGLAKPAKQRHETTSSPGGGGGSASSSQVKKGDSVKTIIKKRRKQIADKKGG